MLIRGIILFVAVFFWVCCNAPEKKYINYQEIKKLTEVGTAYFDPGFIKSEHIVVVFKIKNYKILDSLDDSKCHPIRYKRTVAGAMPSMRAGGPFEVIIKNDHPSDSILYRYRMPSPLYHRIENGPNKGLVKVKAGSFEVPVPEKITKNKFIIILMDHDVKKYESILN